MGWADEPLVADRPSKSPAWMQEPVVGRRRNIGRRVPVQREPEPPVAQVQQPATVAPQPASQPQVQPQAQPQPVVQQQPQPAPLPSRQVRFQGKVYRFNGPDWSDEKVGVWLKQNVVQAQQDAEMRLRDSWEKGGAAVAPAPPVAETQPQPANPMSSMELLGAAYGGQQAAVQQQQAVKPATTMMPQEDPMSSVDLIAAADPKLVEGMTKIAVEQFSRNLPLGVSEHVAASKIPAKYRDLFLAIVKRQYAQDQTMKQAGYGVRAATSAIQGAFDFAMPMAKMVGALPKLNPDQERFKQSIIAAREQLDPTIQPDSNWLARNAQSVARMGFPMVQSIGLGKAVGGAGAVVGLGKAGIAVGGALGTSGSFLPQIADQTYTSLIGEKVDPDMAWKITAVSAPIEAAIESILPDPFTGYSAAFRGTVRQVAGKLLKQYIVNYGKELTEEGLQGIVNETALETGRMMDEKIPDKGFGNILMRGVNEMKSAAIPLALMVAPGAVVEGSQVAIESAARPGRLERLKELKAIRDKGFIPAEVGKTTGIPGDTRAKRMAAVNDQIQQLEKEAQDAIENVPSAQVDASGSPRVEAEVQPGAVDVGSEGVLGSGSGVRKVPGPGQEGKTKTEEQVTPAEPQDTESLLDDMRFKGFTQDEAEMPSRQSVEAEFGRQLTDAEWEQAQIEFADGQKEFKGEPTSAAGTGTEEAVPERPAGAVEGPGATGAGRAVPAVEQAGVATGVQAGTPGGTPPGTAGPPVLPTAPGKAATAGTEPTAGEPTGPAGEDLRSLTPSEVEAIWRERLGKKGKVGFAPSKTEMIRQLEEQQESQAAGPAAPTSPQPPAPPAGATEPTPAPEAADGATAGQQTAPEVVPAAESQPPKKVTGRKEPAPEVKAEKIPGVLTPWEQTQGEYVDQDKDVMAADQALVEAKGKNAVKKAEGIWRRRIAEAQTRHRAIVADAVRQKFPVAEKVLQPYPDLTPEKPAAPVEPVATAAPFKEKRTTRKIGNQQKTVAIRTFTGTTSEEYDAFLDSRSEVEDVTMRQKVGNPVWSDPDGGNVKWASYEYVVEDQPTLEAPAAPVETQAAESQVKPFEIPAATASKKPWQMSKEEYNSTDVRTARKRDSVSTAKTAAEPIMDSLREMGFIKEGETLEDALKRKAGQQSEFYTDKTRRGNKKSQTGLQEMSDRKWSEIFRDRDSAERFRKAVVDYIRGNKNAWMEKGESYDSPLIHTPAKHEQSIADAIASGKIESHPDYPELSKPAAPAEPVAPAKPVESPKPELAPDTARIQAEREAKEVVKQQAQQRVSPEGYAGLPDKTRTKFEAAWDGADAQGMNALLDPSNKALRAEFERRSGVELPKTIKGTQEAVDGHFAAKSAAPVEPVLPNIPTAREAVEAGTPYAEWRKQVEDAFRNEQIDETHPAWKSFQEAKPGQFAGQPLVGKTVAVQAPHLHRPIFGTVTKASIVNGIPAVTVLDTTGEESSQSPDTTIPIEDWISDRQRRDRPVPDEALKLAKTKTEQQVEPVKPVETTAAPAKNKGLKEAPAAEPQVKPTEAPAATEKPAPPPAKAPAKSEAAKPWVRPPLEGRMQMSDADRETNRTMAQEGSQDIRTNDMRIAQLEKESSGLRRNAHKKKAALAKEAANLRNASEAIRRQQQPYRDQLERDSLERAIESAPNEAQWLRLMAERERLLGRQGGRNRIVAPEAMESANRYERRLNDLFKDEARKYVDELNVDELSGASEQGRYQFQGPYKSSETVEGAVANAVKMMKEARGRDLLNKLTTAPEVQRYGTNSGIAGYTHYANLSSEQRTAFADEVRKAVQHPDWYQRVEKIRAKVDSAQESAAQKEESDRAETHRKQAEEAAKQAAVEKAERRGKAFERGKENRFWMQVKAEGKALEGEMEKYVVEIGANDKEPDRHEVTGEIMPGGILGLSEEVTWNEEGTKKEKTVLLTHIPTGRTIDWPTTMQSGRELVALMNRAGVDWAKLPKDVRGFEQAEGETKETLQKVARLRQAWSNTNLGALEESEQSRMLGMVKVAETTVQADLVLNADDLGITTGPLAGMSVTGAEVVKNLANEVPEFAYDPVFRVEKSKGRQDTIVTKSEETIPGVQLPAGLKLVYRDGFKFSFEPGIFNLTEGELREGQTVGINLEDLGIKRSEPADVVKAQLELIGFSVSKTKNGLTAKWTPAVAATGTAAEVEAAKKNANVLKVTGSGENWTVTESNRGSRSMRGIAQAAVDKIRWKQPGEPGAKPAEPAAEHQAKIDQEQERVAKHKEVSQAAAEADSKVGDVDGFVSAMPPMQKKRATDALSTSIRHNGVLMQRQELVAKAISDGATVQTKQVVDEAAKKKLEAELKTHRDYPIGNQEHPETKRVNEIRAILKDGGPLMTERRLVWPGGSWLPDVSISKTAMDYAEYLIGKQAASEKGPAEPAPAEPPPAKTKLQQAAEKAKQEDKKAEESPKLRIGAKRIGKPPISKETLQSVFPGSNITPAPNGYYVEVGNSFFQVEFTPNIELDPAVLNSVPAHLRDKIGAAGSFSVVLSDGTRHDGLGLMRLAEELADDKTVRHEAVHLAHSMGLFGEAEWQALVDAHAKGATSEAQQEEMIAIAHEAAEADAGVWSRITRWIRQLLAKIGIGRYDAADIHKAMYDAGFWQRQTTASGSTNTRHQLRARPDLANIGESQQARDLVDEVDEARNQAGLPERRADEDVQQAADDRLKLDYDKERESLLNKGRTGQQLDDVETLMAKAVFNREAEKAFRSGKEDDLTAAMAFMEAYRNTGSEQGRAFRQRQDPIESPAERYARLLSESILEPPEKMREKRNDARRRGDHNTADKINADWAKKIAELKAKLLALGVDLDNLWEHGYDKRKAVQAARIIQTVKATTSDKMYEYWRNSILSAVTTQAANVIGNVSNAGWHFTAERMTEAVVNAAMRRGEGAQLGEFKYILGGILPGWSRGARNFLTTWRTEMPELESQIGRNQISKLETAGLNVAIGGKPGRAIRVPQRLLLAVDDFAKSMIVEMEVGARAYRIAKAEGKEGDALRIRIAQLTADFESSAWDQAYDSALELTFQQEGGDLLKKVKRNVLSARRDIPGLRYFIPFVVTPANIFAEGLSKSPLGSINVAYKMYENYKNGDNVLKGQSAEIAQQVLAWAITLSLMGLLDDDDPWITGTEPSLTRGSREVAYRTRPSMSFRAGDNWYSYSRIEPFATAIGITVDWLNALRSGDAERTVKLPFNSLIGQLKDKTFLSGIGDIIEAIELDDPVNSLIKLGANFTTSWVPNIVRSGIREADKNVMQTRVWGKGSDLYGMIGKRTGQKAGIPVAKKYPIYDVWGRPAERSDIPGPAATDWLYRMTVPARVQKDELFVADRLLINWNNQHADDAQFPSSPMPRYTVDGETKYMTDAQYADFTRLAGESARFALEKFRLNPENPTAETVELIGDVVERAREAVKETLIKQWQGESVSVKPIELGDAIHDETIKTLRDLKRGEGKPEVGRKAATPYKKRLAAFKKKQDRAKNLLKALDSGT